MFFSPRRKWMGLGFIRNLNKETLGSIFFGVVLSMIGFCGAVQFLSIGVITLCANGILFSNIQWTMGSLQQSLFNRAHAFISFLYIRFVEQRSHRMVIRCQQKSLLLLLPFHFAVQPGLTRKHLLWMKLLWMALMVLAVYGAWYTIGTEIIYHLYISVPKYPTLGGMDHIRF